MLECGEIFSDPGTLDITIKDRPKQHFTLWFPEIIWRKLPYTKPPARPQKFQEAYDAYALFDMTNPLWKNTQWMNSGTGKLQRTLTFDTGTVACSVQSQNNEICLDIDLTNNTSDLWMYCFAEVCLRLSPSLDFADLTRERTYGRINNRWISLHNSPTSLRDQLTNTYLATPENPFHKECLRDWWSDDFSVHLDHPLIAVHDQQNKAVISISFEPYSGYCNNLHANMACIHSDPYFDSIKPDSTKTAKGKIEYFEGSIEEFLSSAHLN